MQGCKKKTMWELCVPAPDCNSNYEGRLFCFIIYLKALFSMSSRPALGSTQPPIQWVPGALSRG
jgi:hypothetical protein